MRVLPAVVACLAVGIGFSGCRAKEETPDVARLLADMRSADQQVSGQGA